MQINGNTNLYGKRTYNLDFGSSNFSNTIKPVSIYDTYDKTETEDTVEKNNTENI